MAAYEVLLLNTAIPQIQAAQSGDTYVVPRDIAFSTVANLANGTNLLPSLTFSSDTNTGIYREGADALGFTAGGGSDQMVLTSTGLGIGTNNPGTRLVLATDDSATTGQLRFARSVDVSYFWEIGRDNNLTGAFVFSNASGGAKTERARISSDGTFRVKGAGTAGSTDAVQFSGSAPASAMTLDASGNFYVGTTSQVGGSNITFNQPNNADLKIAASVSTATRAVYQVFVSSAVTTVGTENSTGGSLASGTAAYATVLANNGAYPICFATNNTERARITSGGDLLVGGHAAALFGEKFSVVAGAQNGALFKNTNQPDNVALFWNASTTGDAQFCAFATESSYTGRGTISYNRAGGLVAYNTTSDYRAKDILGPVQNPGATIDALKVYEGRMKGATQSRPMLVAHEAQEVAPYAVTGEKDAVNEDGTPKYQQMDVSSLVPLLLAEIQSLRARVAQLEQGA